MMSRTLQLKALPMYVTSIKEETILEINTAIQACRTHLDATDGTLEADHDVIEELMVPRRWMSEHPEWFQYSKINLVTPWDEGYIAVLAKFNWARINLDGTMDVHSDIIPVTQEQIDDVVPVSKCAICNLSLQMHDGLTIKGHDFLERANDWRDGEREENPLLFEMPPSQQLKGQDDLSNQALDLANKVSHPSHYTSHPSGVECIDITQHHNFNVGNAIKYLWRSGLKEGEDTITALSKARQYIDFELEKQTKEKAK